VIATARAELPFVWVHALDTQAVLIACAERCDPREAAAAALDGTPAIGPLLAPFGGSAASLLSSLLLRPADVDRLLAFRGGDAAIATDDESAAGVHHAAGERLFAPRLGTEEPRVPRGVRREGGARVPVRPADAETELTRLLRRGLFAMSAAAIALVAFQIAFRATAPLGNSDVFWQVRTGAVALATGHMPDTEPFSYTIPGVPWNNHEWLFELLAALLHRAFGWGAFRLLVLACWGGAALAVTVTVARRAGLAAALTALCLLHLWAGYKMKPVPQVLSMPLLLAAIHLFRGPTMLRSRARAGALVAYLLVWGNLTAEALTFLPFLALDQVAQRVGPRRARDTDRATLLLVLLAALAPMVGRPGPRCSTTRSAARR